VSQVRVDPREQRHHEKKAKLVATAWKIARHDGFAGLTLHALARAAGLRQPSLYVYFDSKHDLIDALFADGNRELLARVDALDLSSEPERAVRQMMHALVDFCMEDETRAALLFQRPIPGYEPSVEAFAFAREFLARAVEALGRAGLTDPEDVDVFVAVVAGVVNTQLSNDPGSDRWTRHLDRMIDMVFEDSQKRRSKS